MRFDQRVVVITGAASGIGAATASAFAAEGAQVVATDIITVGLQQWRSNGLRMAHDVGCERGWQSVLQETVERFGGVDVLVNNAGISWGGPLIETPPERWQEVMRTNVEGPFLGMKHVVPIMRRKGEGAIVNIASVSALVGCPNSALYAASKGAVVSMSRAAAVELAPLGIRVNSLCPGGVRTQMWERQEWWESFVEQHGSTARAWTALAARTPCGRLADADEVAQGVLYLAAPSSGSTTGTNLVIDGGYAAS